MTGREDRAGAESGSEGGDLVSWSGTVETHRHEQYDSLVRPPVRQSDRMKTSTVVVSLLLVLTHLACGAVLSKVSQHQADSSLETTINVRVSRVVPRHQCRRALRNLEVREREKLKLN